jgi:YtxH-like protein
LSLSALQDVSKDDVLAAVGLSMKTSTMSRVLAATGVFAAGAVLGAATALLLAPKSGKGLREDLGARFGRLELPRTVSELESNLSFDELRT